MSFVEFMKNNLLIIPLVLTVGVIALVIIAATVRAILDFLLHQLFRLLPAKSCFLREME